MEMSCVTEKHEKQTGLSKKTISYMKENAYAKIFFLESVFILNFLGKSEARNIAIFVELICS